MANLNRLATLVVGSSALGFLIAFAIVFAH
jgi:hypothetical protein